MRGNGLVGQVERDHWGQRAARAYSEKPGTSIHNRREMADRSEKPFERFIPRRACLMSADLDADNASRLLRAGAADRYLAQKT